MGTYKCLRWLTTPCHAVMQVREEETKKTGKGPEGQWKGKERKKEGRGRGEERKGHGKEEVKRRKGRKGEGTSPKSRD